MHIQWSKSLTCDINCSPHTKNTYINYKHKKQPNQSKHGNAKVKLILFVNLVRYKLYTALRNLISLSETLMVRKLMVRKRLLRKFQM